MSAYVVDKVHIDAMLTAGLDVVWRRSGGDLRWLDAEYPSDDAYEAGEPWGRGAITWWNDHVQRLTAETAGSVGAMLWAENRRSVNHRYDKEEWEPPYVFDRLPGRPDPLMILKAISGYEYQTCEHPEWLHSEARRFCEVLRGRAISQLPGYDEANSWSINDRDVFVKRAHRDT